MSTPNRSRPSWGRVGEIPLVCFDRRNLIRCVAIALVVGTVLFLINQADAVFAGRATAATWLKVGLTYLVPFLSSQYGIVLASRRSAGADHRLPAPDRRPSRGADD